MAHAYILVPWVLVGWDTLMHREISYLGDFARFSGPPMALSCSSLTTHDCLWGARLRSPGSSPLSPGPHLEISQIGPLEDTLPNATLTPPRSPS